MNQLKRLNFIGTAAAIVLLVVVTAVVISRWPSGGDNSVAAPIPTRPTLEAVPTEAAIVSTEQPTPTRPMPTPIVRVQIEEVVVNQPNGRSEPVDYSGLVYGGGMEDGRLYRNLGLVGLQVYEASTGKDLMPISIFDPDTELLVSVRDIAWGPFLWLGPPEEGLIVLTDPFENGDYLHFVDPETGDILHSFQINNNIAIGTNAELLSESVPTQLAVTENGELYVDRVYNFAPATPDDDPISYHYILRLMLEGRILNSMLVYRGLTNEEVPTVVEALAYQAETEEVIAAVRQEFGPDINVYSLINSPTIVNSLNGERFEWEELTDFITDSQGNTYMLLDSPYSTPRIIQLNSAYEVVTVYGFGNGTGEVSGVDQLLSGLTGQPAGLTVSPDGSVLYVLDQNGGSYNIRAFSLGD